MTLVIYYKIHKILKEKVDYKKSLNKKRRKKSFRYRIIILKYF